MNEQPPLQAAALLVSLNISQWGGHKHDKKTSKEVDATHEAKNAGRYNGLLVPKESLQPIATIAGAARLYLYSVTFAWGNNGDRLLPYELFINPFMSTITNMREQFDKAVKEFVAIYPKLKEDARKWRGTLYNPEDYPVDIADKFAFPEPVVTTLPNAEDFRVNLSSAYVDSIKRQMLAREEEMKLKSNKVCWDRMREHIERIVEVCDNPKSPIYETLMSNPREFLAILPHMNLMRDAKLTLAGQQLEGILVPTDRLKKDKALKAEVARQANALLSTFP
jgi:hypothetical protein